MLLDLHLDNDTLAIISFIGGVLGVTFIFLTMSFLKIKPSPALGGFIIFSACMFLIIARKHIPLFFSVNLILLCAFFLFIVIVRLVFIKDLLVPPYSDSIQHFLIVQDFLNPDAPKQSFFRVSLNPKYYYHFGFHALAAWLSSISKTPAMNTIMLLGQYFQALAVLSIYPLSYIITKNKISAWMAVCIAGLYLSIPAYASNWGKYPAIASLTGIAFVLSVLLASLISRQYPTRKISLVILISMFFTMLLHSRSIIILILAEILFIFFAKNKIEIKNFENKNEKTESIISLIISVTAITFLLVNLSGLKITVFFQFFLLISVMFSFYAKFTHTIALITLIFLTNIALFFSPLITFLPIRFEKLLDLQFLIIFYYLPLSLLLQGGFEGLIKLIANTKRAFWRRCLLVGIFIIGIFNVVLFQKHDPSECCNFINDDDLFAFEWMRSNIPTDIIIGIASTGTTGNLMPVDGGGWIEPLTNIPTRKINIGVEISSIQTKLCNDKVEYLYVEKFENSFDEFTIIEAGGNHVFNLGSVNIYQLDCSDP